MLSEEESNAACCFRHFDVVFLYLGMDEIVLSTFVGSQQICVAMLHQLYFLVVNLKLDCQMKLPVLMAQDYLSFLH